MVMIEALTGYRPPVNETVFLSRKSRPYMVCEERVIRSAFEFNAHGVLGGEYDVLS